jgi:hypothetical protein
MVLLASNFHLSYDGYAKNHLKMQDIIDDVSHALFSGMFKFERKHQTPLLTLVAFESTFLKCRYEYPKISFFLHQGTKFFRKFHLDMC